MINPDDNYSCYAYSYANAYSIVTLLFILADVGKYITSLTFSLPGHPSKNVGSLIGSLRYDWSKFWRRPVGGSLVIFTPFCRTVTGNYNEKTQSNINHSSNR